MIILNLNVNEFHFAVFQWFIVIAMNKWCFTNISVTIATNILK